MESVASRDEALRIAIQKLARRIRSNRGNELGDSQLSVLFTLQREGGMSPAELATREQVTPPSMSRTINALDTRGLVTRSPDPGDARRVIVSITETGQALLRATSELRASWFRDRFHELSAAEQSLLHDVLPLLQRLGDE